MTRTARPIPKLSFLSLAARSSREAVDGGPCFTEDVSDKPEAEPAPPPDVDTALLMACATKGRGLPPDKDVVRVWAGGRTN